MASLGDAMVAYGPPPEDGGPAVSLSGCPAAVESNALRNPGVIVYVFHPAAGEKSLSEEAKQWVRDFGKKYGYTVSSELKIAKKYGPDGKTPMVMKNLADVAPADKNPPVNIRIALQFPTKNAAEEALKYIDENGYAATVVTLDNGRPGIYATTIIPASEASEEFNAFGPMVKHFGGSVEWVGSGQ